MNLLRFHRSADPGPDPAPALAMLTKPVHTLTAEASLREALGEAFRQDAGFQSLEAAGVTLIIQHNAACFHVALKGTRNGNPYELRPVFRVDEMLERQEAGGLAVVAAQVVARWRGDVRRNEFPTDWHGQDAPEE